MKIINTLFCIIIYIACDRSVERNIALHKNGKIVGIQLSCIRRRMDDLTKEVLYLDRLKKGIYNLNIYLSQFITDYKTEVPIYLQFIGEKSAKGI